MSKVIELSDNIKVSLNDKFTPKKRNEVRSIALKANKTDVDSEYKAIAVFIDNIQQVNAEGIAEDKTPDWLIENVSMEDYDKVVDAVLEIVKFDKGVHRLIGVAFAKIEMTEEEKADMQKKMQEKS